MKKLLQRLLPKFVYFHKSEIFEGIPSIILSKFSSVIFLRNFSRKFQEILWKIDEGSFYIVSEGIPSEISEGIHARVSETILKGVS